jgi:FkbM family methyltransferase
MMITVPDLVRYFGVNPTGVLHVGAHKAEEAEDYAGHNWGHVTWVEMLPEKYAALQTRFANDPQNTVLNAACWDSDGVVLPLFRADNGQSSSLMEPTEHLVSHPDVTFQKETTALATSRLDTLLPPTTRFDFINFDIQGAELRALRGLGKRLAEVKWAYLEINTKRLYDDCPLVTEIDTFLQPEGFQRVVTRMWSNSGWGDALYVNTRGMSGAELLKLKTGTAAYNLRSPWLVKRINRWKSRPVIGKPL